MTDKAKSEWVLGDDNRWRNTNPHAVHYAADHGDSPTMGDLIDELIAAESSDDFCDLLDKRFLFGAWHHAIEFADPKFLRDVRGLLWGLREKLKDADYHPDDCGCAACEE